MGSRAAFRARSRSAFSLGLCMWRWKEGGRPQLAASMFAMVIERDRDAVAEGACKGGLQSNQGQRSA